jgi:hypothetical protein
VSVIPICTRGLHQGQLITLAVLVYTYDIAFDFVVYDFLHKVVSNLTFNRFFLKRVDKELLLVSKDN